jgi:ABC-type molybdate transport system substrate-binding protein
MTHHQLPRIPASRKDDLHNLDAAVDCDLALFMAGNQFMAMEALLEAFQADYPEVRKIYYETLPPGLELKQILAGGALFGDQRLAIYPDIYTSVNLRAMQVLEQEGHIHPGQYHLYLHNRLTILVPRGNPARIKTVTDLGRSDVRISQPDPDNEDIALHIMDMYRAAGGDDLVRSIMEDKRAAGTTIMTIVHHRETPLRIQLQTVDAGPVWATEAIHAQASGLPCDVIDPGDPLDQRHNINYYLCRLARAPHLANAEKFMAFMRSAAAHRIYRQYGFLPHGTQP